MTQVWAFRIHCNILFPYRRRVLASTVPDSILHCSILENAANFATILPVLLAEHLRIFALSTTLFPVIVGEHQLETANGADPREGGRGVGA